MQPPDGQSPPYKPGWVRRHFRHRSVAAAALFFAILGGGMAVVLESWAPLLGCGLSWLLVAHQFAVDEALVEQRNQALAAADAVPQIEVERAAMREMGPRDRTINDALASTADRARSNDRVGRLYEAQLAARVNGWLYRVGSGR